MRTEQVLKMYGMVGQKLPTTALPEVQFESYKVWVLPAYPQHEAKFSFGKMRRRRVAKHRVQCECQNCGWQGSFGRAHQHACMKWAKARTEQAYDRYAQGGA